MNELKNLALSLCLQNKNSYKYIEGFAESMFESTPAYDKLRKSLGKALKLANIDVPSFEKDLQKRNVKFTTIFDLNYPPLLKQCEDAPLVIFYVGNKELLLHTGLVSVVGTRTMTAQGRSIIEELIPNLKTSVVVSGMAFGVDAYSHSIAIDNNINTIAVLPDSCDKPTPFGNINLYRRILDSGNLILSDHPPGKKSHPGLYPKRNRIIAGLSRKTIVIEAGLKSGALITADIAFSYNREVFAFPGGVGQYTFKGCNYLIKNNIAQLIENSNDFLGLLNSKVIDQKLTEVERTIYYAILREPKTLSELSELLGLRINELGAICTKLQINGILNTDNQNKFYVS